MKTTEQMLGGRKRSVDQIHCNTSHVFGDEQVEVFHDELLSDIAVERLSASMIRRRNSNVRSTGRSTGPSGRLSGRPSSTSAGGSTGPSGRLSGRFSVTSGRNTAESAGQVVVSSKHGSANSKQDGTPESRDPVELLTDESPTSGLSGSRPAPRCSSRWSCARLRRAPREQVPDSGELDFPQRTSVSPSSSPQGYISGTTLHTLDSLSTTGSGLASPVDIGTTSLDTLPPVADADLVDTNSLAEDPIEAADLETPPDAPPLGKEIANAADERKPDDSLEALGKEIANAAEERKPDDCLEACVTETPISPMHRVRPPATRRTNQSSRHIQTHRKTYRLN